MPLVDRSGEIPPDRHESACSSIMETANVTEAKDIGMFLELRRFSDKTRGLMEKPNKGDFATAQF